MTRQELAARIKAKYPQYADVPDEELVSKVVAKYPQYGERLMDSQGAGAGGQEVIGAGEEAPPPSPPPVEEGPGAMSRFFGGVRDVTLDPAVEMIQGLVGGAAKNPMKAATVVSSPGALGQALAEPIIEGQAGQFQKMFELEDQGLFRPKEGGLSILGRAAAGTIPLVGPLAADVVETGAGGNVAGAAGKMAGILGMGEVAGAAGRVVRGRANRAVARGIAREGMESVRDAAPIFNAAREAEAVKAAEAIKGMVGMANEPTFKQRINAALGVKPKHLKKGYDPVEGVIRQDIEVLDKAPEEVIGSVSSRMDELSGKKAERLKVERSVTSADEVRKVADMLKPMVSRAKKMGNDALAKRAAAARKSLRALVTDTLDVTGAVKRKAPFGGNLSPKDMSDIIGQLDDMIEVSTGAAGRKVQQRLFKIREELNNRLVAGDPELGVINRDLRDLIPAKRALQEKALQEKASAGPKPKEAPKPEGLGEPALPPPTAKEAATILGSLPAELSYEVARLLMGGPWAKMSAAAALGKKAIQGVKR